MFQIKKIELGQTNQFVPVTRNVKLDLCNPAEFELNFLLLFLEFTLEIKISLFSYYRISCEISFCSITGSLLK